MNWRESVIVSFCKKGDRSSCKTQRVISLASISPKQVGVSSSTGYLIHIEFARVKIEPVSDAVGIVLIETSLLLNRHLPWTHDLCPS